MCLHHIKNFYNPHNNNIILTLEPLVVLIILFTQTKHCLKELFWLILCSFLDSLVTLDNFHLRELYVSSLNNNILKSYNSYVYQQYIYYK